MKSFLWVFAALLAGVFCSTAWSDETDDAAAKRAIEKGKRIALGPELFELRYKFQPGEMFRTKVVHLVTVETKIKGVTETAKTRSTSTKLWKIQAIDDKGNMTFAHSVEAVDMWQQTSGRAEISYNSQTDKEPPPEYELVAASIGKALSTITIDQQGSIVNRDKVQFNSGIGDLTVPLPKGQIKVGHEWHLPQDIIIRMPDMQVKTIKAREKFTLLKVETGIATISVKTEILTPVTDPKIQSQLVQRMQQGEIKFDIDAGRIRSKQMDLDETVIGFSGQNSVMKYLARLTEEPGEAPAATANKPTSAKR